MLTVRPLAVRYGSRRGQTGELTIVSRVEMLVTFHQYPATSRWHHVLASKTEPLDYGNGVSGGIRRITEHDMKGWERNRLGNDDDDDGAATAGDAHHHGA